MPFSNRPDPLRGARGRQPAASSPSRAQSRRTKGAQMIETTTPAASAVVAAAGTDPTPFLSKKPIPVAERLIFALDVPDLATARRLVATLGDAVTFYKVGLELFMAGSTFDLVDELAAQGKKIFVDLK